MQLPTLTAAIRHIARSPIFWVIAVTAILIAVAARVYLSRPVGEWAAITDQGPAQALQSPFLLFENRSPTLFWQPLNAPTPLTAQTLNAPPVTYDILPYGDLAPRRWRAAPAGPDAYHLVWLEANGRLRCALLSTDGETLRGPIDLADSAQHDFAVLPLEDGRARLIWIDQPAGHMITAILDDDGRPSPPSNPVLRRADYFAAGIDQNDEIHLAWLTLSAPRHWTLYYQSSRAADFTIDAPHNLYTMALTPDQAITTLNLGLDESHAYLIWGISAADHPDTERVYALTFPLGSSDQAILYELRFPQAFAPSNRLEPPMPIGYIGALAGSSKTTAALRWPSPAAGQHRFLPLALALRTADGWRPAVAYFQHGELLGYQIAAWQPADAGPPVVAFDQGGVLHLAWLALKGATPHMYTASTS